MKRSEIVAYVEDVLDPELQALRAERDRLARAYFRALRRQQEQRRVQNNPDMDVALYRWVREETERARAYGQAAGLRIAARASVA